MNIFCYCFVFGGVYGVKVGLMLAKVHVINMINKTGTENCIFQRLAFSEHKN